MTARVKKWLIKITFSRDKKCPQYVNLRPSSYICEKKNVVKEGQTFILFLRYLGIAYINESRIENINMKN